MIESLYFLTHLTRRKRKKKSKKKLKRWETGPILLRQKNGNNSRKIYGDLGWQQFYHPQGIRMRSGKKRKKKKKENSKKNLWYISGLQVKENLSNKSRWIFGRKLIQIFYFIFLIFVPLCQDDIRFFTSQNR